MTKNKTGAVWEDREVLFDLPFAYLKLRPGEKIFDRIEPIEDTKGNSGTKGRMVVTNLRIIWHSLASPRINLSIGLNCILNTNTKVVNSGLRGTTQALNVLAAYKTNKYEFIFTNLSPNCVRHYTSVAGVHKAYTGSRLYRDLKLRAAIIHNKQLRMLPLEKIALLEHSIWNLSSDSGNLGTLIITNVRVVWFADINDAFNISMPYITIESLNSEDLNDGPLLYSEENCKTYFENLTNRQHLSFKDSQNNQAQSSKNTKKRKPDTSLSYVIRNEPGKCHHLINIAVYDLSGDTVPGINCSENNNARVSVQYLVKDYCDDIMDEIEYLIGKIVKKLACLINSESYFDRSVKLLITYC